MAITTFTLTFDASDHLGQPVAKCSYQVRINGGSDVLVFTAENKTRLFGGWTEAPAGVVNAVLPHTNITGANPFSFQYQVTVEAVLKSGAMMLVGPVVFSAPTGTTTVVLEDQLGTQGIAPTYVSTLKTQLDNHTASLETQLDDHAASLEPSLNQYVTDAAGHAQDAHDLVTADLETSDGQVYALVSDPNSQTGAELWETFASAGRIITDSLKIDRQPIRDLYVPSVTSLEKWRRLRNAVLAGATTVPGRINILGDSIAWGHADPTNLPKPFWSWPGRLRGKLDGRYGEAGTGIALAWPELLTNPTWDPRWTFGVGAELGPFGPYKAGSVMWVNNGGYGVFTGYMDRVTIYTLAGNGISKVIVDGIEIGTIRNGLETTGYTLSPLYDGRQGVVEIDLTDHSFTLGEHTIRVEKQSGNRLCIMGIEAHVTGTQKFSVTSTAMNGKGWDLAGFNAVHDYDGYYDGETNLFGPSVLVDVPNGDLTVIALGINDVFRTQTTASIKASATEAVQRARGSGTTNQNIPYADGDALLVVVPRYQWSAIFGDTVAKQAAFEAYRDAFYEIADEQDVALLDLADRWTDFDVSNALGFHHDPYHPSTFGAQDIADAVYWALFEN